MENVHRFCIVSLKYAFCSSIAVIWLTIYKLLPFLHFPASLSTSWSALTLLIKYSPLQDSNEAHSRNTYREQKFSCWASHHKNKSYPERLRRLYPRTLQHQRRDLTDAGPQMHPGKYQVKNPQFTVATYFTPSLDRLLCLTLHVTISPIPSLMFSFILKSVVTEKWGALAHKPQLTTTKRDTL